jgi:serine/threonine protein kinase
VSNRRDDGTSLGSDTAIEGGPVRRAGEESGGTLAAGTVLAARYEVRRPIGRGGMGVVVEAFDRVLGVSVAIKIVRAEYAGEREWSDRLAREVKLARQIQHPNVCRVFDFAQADGRAFLIMELATGGTLRDEIQAATTRARSLSASISDARALAAGLAAIHAAGIVHRDISPQNALRMGDGRLVLSDFGLATDAFDGTTSIHGGTVAYMAPEVLRGGRASVAADLWSVGAVIHDVVFGERLIWDTETGEMRSPAAAREVSPIERSLLDLCYACVAADPARRPRSAQEVASRLSDAGLARAVGRRARRRAAVAMIAVGAVALAAVAAMRIEASRKRWGLTAAAASADPMMIIPTGEPEDWTDTSKVLAEIPDRVRCMVRLPDHHAVRVVWGYPAHAEDIDILTGKRRPSPLAPDAYAEGCPDVSADGKRLVYAGHTADDRSFAFLALNSDGSAGVPVVPIAEPSMSSDPTWLPDGDSFVYEADTEHVGVFSVSIRRTTILSGAAEKSVIASHGVAGNEIFVSATLGATKGDVIGVSFPQLDRDLEFRLPWPILDVQSRDGSRYVCTLVTLREPPPFAVVDTRKREARWGGFVRNEYPRYPTFLDAGLAWVGFQRSSRVWRRSPDGQRTTLLGSSNVASAAPYVATAAPCGSDLAVTVKDGGRILAERLDLSGRRLAVFNSGKPAAGPVCSSDGRTVFFTDLTIGSAVVRCEDQRCSVLAKVPAAGLALSTDGARLAFVDFSNRGLFIRWIDSHGGAAHGGLPIETACTPRWSSGKDLWISRRQGRQLVWTEIDTDTLLPTGRTRPGTRDCSDGIQDPAAPALQPIGLDEVITSRVRLLANKDLSANEEAR